MRNNHSITKLIFEYQTYPDRVRLHASDLSILFLAIIDFLKISFGWEDTSLKIILFAGCGIVFLTWQSKPYIRWESKPNTIIIWIWCDDANQKWDVEKRIRFYVVVIREWYEVGNHYRITFGLRSRTIQVQEIEQVIKLHQTKGFLYI